MRERKDEEGGSWKEEGERRRRMKEVRQFTMTAGEEEAREEPQEGRGQPLSLSKGAAPPEFGRPRSKKAQTRSEINGTGLKRIWRASGRINLGRRIHGIQPDRIPWACTHVCLHYSHSASLTCSF